jgi:NADPH-dependent ferric siderophore reductase
MDHINQLGHVPAFSMTESTHDTASPRSVQRVRHVLKVRRVSVRAVRRLSPHVASITFAGDELRDFVSASFDDHVKLMLPPAPGQALVLPVLQADGTRAAPAPGSVPPVMRDYTPRRIDHDAGELDIELALHGDGPAARWAAQAAPGQQVGIGGPRGSFVVPTDYDWHLLIGDTSALPAIARRLEELPADTRALVLVQVDDAADQRALASRAQVRIEWLVGAADPQAALLRAVRALALPAGEGYAWAAGEAHATAAVRGVLVDELGIDRHHVRAAAYWKHGAVAHHENIDA